MLENRCYRCYSLNDPFKGCSCIREKMKAEHEAFNARMMQANREVGFWPDINASKIFGSSSAPDKHEYRRKKKLLIGR